MTYVDGFVFVVPKKNFKEYKKMANLGKKVWKKHGALEYIECIGDDLNPSWAKATFPKITKKKPSEDVWFAYIVFKNKKHRDQVNAKVMKDPFMSPENQKDQKSPFDINKMTYGGFRAVVE